MAWRPGESNRSWALRDTVLTEDVREEDADAGAARDLTVVEAAGFPACSHADQSVPASSDAVTAPGLAWRDFSRATASQTNEPTATNAQIRTHRRRSVVASSLLP